MVRALHTWRRRRPPHGRWKDDWRVWLLPLGGSLAYVDPVVHTLH